MQPSETSKPYIIIWPNEMRDMRFGVYVNTWEAISHTYCLQLFLPIVSGKDHMVALAFCRTAKECALFLKGVAVATDAEKYFLDHRFSTGEIYE